MQTKYKTSYILSVFILILATIASAGGLFIPGLYRNNATIISAFRGNDLVTLVVAIPLMLGALVQSKRGSEKAELVWVGTIGYMLYNYLFYLYGVAFNGFFLIYVALFTLSIYALIFSLINIDVNKISKRFHTRTPVKYISGFMIFFALLLGGIWVALSLSFVVTGQVPLQITQTGHPTGVVFATDLSVLIPALLLSAIWLWKRTPWGYVFSTVVMVKTSTYGLALLAMSAFAYAETGKGDAMIALWIFLSLGCWVSCGLLFWNLKSDINC